MTLLEFNELQPNKRSEIVWDWGYILSDRRTETHKIVLFSISDFFVEVSFEIKNENACNIKGFSKEELHPDYLIQLGSENPFIRTAFHSTKALVKQGEKCNKIL